MTSTERLDVAAVDYVLSTTRSVRRRLDFDRPLPRAVIEEAIKVAVQAPTGGGVPRWHWYVIDDPGLKQQLADLLQAQFSNGKGDGYFEMIASVSGAEHAEKLRVSTMHLVDNYHRLPYIVIPTMWNPVPLGELDSYASNLVYGSIMPAAWSFLLALRARGVGSAWTAGSLQQEDKVREIVGIDPDHRPIAVFPVAYTIGTDFKPVARETSSIVHWNRA
ncbi:nitroreductase family protein [Mycobacteroides chelonae]|uniref:Nitroreductase domain-containing protein n=1 Tax=Mycobacteroides chelonae TaxID=1774 RepID=A0A1S1M194_MYCCH|nr:nitroreductase family protein [Mycobacteroides chelonae]OHU78834.1 hypothetical protein BKG84_10940 [Mycobacteroides chelonae]QQG85963.1 nitroreductase family protein [Mycobacteroides chelonae]QQG90780.1 nitroreductase family protein [Mycobacteroides chelonae]